MTDPFDMLENAGRVADVQGHVFVTVSGAEVEVLDWLEGSDNVRVLYLRTGQERTLPAESLQPPPARVVQPGTSAIVPGASVRIQP